MGITKNNKGFSLIELSIVLIIIGLLVAGITGGASLIKSAQLRSIMSEARGYRMAVNAYYTSEDALPGDDDGANGGASDDGNINGRIEALNAADQVEGVEAWNDMSDPDIGIVDMAQVTLPAVTTGKVPALAITLMGGSKFTGAGWTFDYATTPTSGGSALTDSIASNVLIFTGATLATAVAVPGSAVEIRPNIIITGIDAYSIDKKMDDGAFDSGSVYGLDAENTVAGTDAGSCITTATTNLCAMAFKIDL